MPVFQFENILLHQLPDNQGWQIIGINYDKSRELIIYLPPEIGEDKAQIIANRTARDLTGKPSAEID